MIVMSLRFPTVSARELRTGKEPLVEAIVKEETETPSCNPLPMNCWT